jgi:putative transposase
MNQNRRRKNSLRKPGYDYANDGAYFVTICTHQRTHLFGRIVDGKMILNAYGQIAAEEWEYTSRLRSNVILDAWVIMPNHTHAIIVRRGASQCARDNINAHANHTVDTLGTIVRGFKGSVTRRIKQLDNPPEHPIWQRGYHDHIIRNQRGFDTIQAYIIANPSRWYEDSLFT